MPTAVEQIGGEVENVIALSQGAAYPSRELLHRLAGSQQIGSLFVGQIPDSGFLPPNVPITTFFPSGPLRRESWIRQHGATYWRVSLYEASRALARQELNIFAAVVKVTPARSGSYSVAYHADYAVPLLETSEALILEECSHAPWFGGHLDSNDTRIREVFREPFGCHPVIKERTRDDWVMEALASRVAEVVPSDAAVQIGMGSWTTSVSIALARKGIHRFHTGLAGEWLPAVAGVPGTADQLQIASSAITDDKGVCAAAEALFRRGQFRLAPATEVHRPSTLMGIDSFVAINSAWEVDLLGQANCEILVLDGDRLRSGIGGLADFAQAAASHPKGISILVIPSKTQKISRIVPKLPRNRVSLEGKWVDIVVTEHGVADLRGVRTEDRPEQLLAIADPLHRGRLERQLREEEG